MIELSRPNPILDALGISRERVAELCAAMDAENGEKYERAKAKLLSGED